MSTIIQSICVKKIIDFSVMDDQVVEETHVPLDQSDKGGEISLQSRLIKVGWTTLKTRMVKGKKTKKRKETRKRKEK